MVMVDKMDAADCLGMDCLGGAMDTGLDVVSDIVDVGGGFWSDTARLAGYDFNGRRETTITDREFP